MTPHETFEQGLDDGRRGMTPSAEDRSYLLDYQAGSAMHGIPASKDRPMTFIDADLALGMYEQSFANDREHLLAYAVKEGLMWAMPEFLARHGCLDADWVVLINRKVN